MKDGILNINKPQEMTSFDVVAILRKKLGVKRIGHLGTLDPMAEGVLPVAIGKATRVMDYLNADTKEYIAEVVFGIGTDTDDVWGKVIGASASDRAIDEITITRDELDVAVKNQIGVIDQIPPKYAAIKVEGRKLYEYARAGQDVEVKSRKVYIPKIEIVDFGRREFDNLGGEFFYAVLAVTCSKGTYIRSIARDLGKELGTQAVMSALIRTRSGAFGLGSAVSIDTIRDMEAEEIEGLMVSPSDALSVFPIAVLGEWESRLFKNGVSLRKDQWERIGYLDGSTSCDYLDSFPLDLPDTYRRLYRVFDKNAFLGMGLEEEGGLKADKVLF